MSSPDPTAVRRRLILLARDVGLSLAVLNDVLTDLGLNPYPTTDFVGRCVANIQTDLADPTPRPTLAELRSLIRVEITNSPLNEIQVSEWQGFDVLGYDGATGVLRLQLFLRANRTSATNAELVSAARAVVRVVPYSNLVTLPNFSGQLLNNFAFNDPDPDDPA
jgi:hypothetical protein